MNKWLVATIVILVCACIYLVYSCIDSGITADYMKQGQISKNKEIKELCELLKDMNSHMTRKEITSFIRGKYNDKGKYIIKESGDELSMNDIVFKFKDDKLVSIKMMDE